MAGFWDWEGTDINLLVLCGTRCIGIGILNFAKWFVEMERNNFLNMGQGILVYFLGTFSATGEQ